MKKRIISNPALKSWDALNEFLKTASEDDCIKLMAQEREYVRRASFIKRIHSRLNKVRADRERKEIQSAETGSN